MRIGIELRGKMIVAGVLTSVAVLLAGRSAIESRDLDMGVPLIAGSGELARRSPRQKEPKNGESPDPSLHYQRLEMAESQPYTGTGRNIFRSEPATRPSRVPLPPKPSPPAPIDGPVVPSITLRLFGFASMLNQPRKAVLGEGDSLFVANEGDIVDRRYRVVRINSNSVVVEDLIEKSTHELELHG